MTARYSKFAQTLTMILITFAFYAPQEWFFTVPFASLLAAALLVHGFITSWLCWTLITAHLGFIVAQLWLEGANGLYLLLYVSMIAQTATLSKDPFAVFRRNARLLVGCVFALAVFWKVISPGFLTGDFFAYNLLYDDRLAPVAVLLTELTSNDVRANREMLKGPWDQPIQLITSAQVNALSHALTWLVLITEASVALSFLGVGKLAERLRNPALSVFLSGAYFIVPVPVFGMCLAALGYSYSTSTFYDRVYLTLFIAMPLTALRYHFFSVV